MLIDWKHLINSKQKLLKINDYLIPSDLNGLSFYSLFSRLKTIDAFKRLTLFWELIWILLFCRKIIRVLINWCNFSYRLGWVETIWSPWRTTLTLFILQLNRMCLNWIPYIFHLHNIGILSMGTAMMSIRINDVNGCQRQKLWSNHLTVVPFSHLFLTTNRIILFLYIKCCASSTSALD